MPSHVRIGVLFALALPAFAGLPRILLIGDEPGSWGRILSSVGLTLTQATHLPPSELVAQVQSGAFVILEGASDYSERFGIHATAERAVPTRNIVDRHNPGLAIIWEKTLAIPRFELPPGAIVFAREKWTGIPVLAGLRAGSGHVLWTAARPGERGYERFPYLLQAMAELGVASPLRSNRLWAFLDGAYRSRVDLDYFARRWQAAGISALHVAAWHHYESSPEKDAWLKELIEACHRRAILVYAWLELPHVSEQFWQDHPEWREQTALLQDAHLDWRKLMNLTNPDCFRAVSQGVTSLINRFDWDGVNLAELYFESLEGHANPARFTPMNADVRREFEQLSGRDPLDLIRGKAQPEALAEFLQYRAEIARRIQQQWITVIEHVRRSRSHLDLVLTHVDDRFDTRMRDLIGADAGRVLPLLEQHDFTFLIEDPATIWNLGPDRYPQIAEKYRPLTARREKLAIDINIVERYQDVYPTKQQTGVELFQLVNLASKAFPRVALYFENSILRADLPLLPAAASGASRFEPAPNKVVVDSARGLGVDWASPPRVNGQAWPVWDGKTVWLPRGPHVIEPNAATPALCVTGLNAELRSAAVVGDGIEIGYEASTRALATLSERPGAVLVDGEAIEPQWINESVLALPRGQHLVTFRRRSSASEPATCGGPAPTRAPSLHVATNE